MFQFIRNVFSRTRWYPLSSLPEGYFTGRRDRPPVATNDDALTLSPVYAALRWYQTTLSSLPLVTYRATDNGREEATGHAAYNLLKHKPNPAQTRNTFLQVVARELFLHGEAFVQLRWRGNNSLFGLYPIPHCRVSEVIVDEEWNKAYVVRLDGNDVEVVEDADMLHVVAVPDTDGIRGIGFLQYAGESLGLHKAVQESARTYYQKAAKLSGYLKYPNKLNKETINTIREQFKEQYQGTANAGEIAALSEGGEFVALPGTSAEDAQIIQALGSSVGDVGRWTGVSSMLLGDYSAAKYNSLAAENQAAYQKSLRWMLEAIETELNVKVFGPGADTFAEFDTTGVTRGDPMMQAQIDQIYLTSGVKVRNEVRASLNLPAIPELDTPLAPLNQGAADATPVSPAQLPAPTDPTQTTPAPTEGQPA